MIKLIAIDLDDTLLNKEKQISKENKLAIKEAIDNNIEIVIATGRPYFRVKSILKELKLDNEFSKVILLNGGYICNGINTLTIYEKRLNNDDIQKIVKIINNYHLCFNVYQKDEIYTSKLSDEIINLPVYDGINFKYISNDEILNMEYAHKLIVAEDKQNIFKYKEEIIKQLPNYTVVQSTPNFLEIAPYDINKGNAILKLANYLNIKQDEIMAIGDAENDLPMLNVARYKVVMENANSDIKNIASFITKSCNDDGVAIAIRKVINEKI